MSDMKCPICGNALEQSDGFPELFMCLNCQINMKHNQWQELIRTRKALDVALKCLNGVGKELPWVKRALAEITALEQKDK